MIKTRKLLIAGLALFTGWPVFAQDVFRTVGTSTRSYNYVEVQYLLDVDVDRPFYISLWVNINEKFSFTGRYFEAEADIPLTNGTIVAIDARTIQAGLAYHRPLEQVENADLVVSLQLGEAKAEARDFGVSASNSFQEGYAGVRKTVNEKIEVEAGVTLLLSDGDTDFSGDLKAVYRVLPFLDVALGLQDLGSDELIGFGLRYTW